MADIKVDYAASTSLTVTGASTLANGSSANSTAINNSTSTNRFLDIVIYVTVTTSASASATGTVELRIKGSLDGTNFDDDTNDRWIGTISLAAAGAQTLKKVVSVAPAYGGPIPPYVMLRVRNATGQPLSAATFSYLGIYADAT